MNWLHSVDVVVVAVVVAVVVSGSPSKILIGKSIVDIPVVAFYHYPMPTPSSAMSRQLENETLHSCFMKCLLIDDLGRRWRWDIAVVCIGVRPTTKLPATNEHTCVQHKTQTERRTVSNNAPIIRRSCKPALFVDTTADH